MEQISESIRPAYYINRNYAPELGQAYHNWNNVSEFLPNMSIWVWDQLDFYIRHNIKIRSIDSDTAIKIHSAYKTARKYHETCSGNSTIDTVVAHMYVCELLVQSLCMVMGQDWSFGHGYESSGLNNIDINDIFSAKVKFKPGGLSHILHALFYKKRLIETQEASLVEYLTLCPELKRFMYDHVSVPKLIECRVSYGATGAHDKSATYHFIELEMMSYHAVAGSAELYNALEESQRSFPEIAEYNIANRYSSFAVEDEKFSDKFVSTTGDPYGKTYALGFGGNNVQKQRDIEIRFGIIFTLGSLGRYRPWIWSKMEDQNPEQYFIIKSFLEHNHIMFPYLVLCYLSGKYFTFNKVAVYG